MDYLQENPEFDGKMWDPGEEDSHPDTSAKPSGVQLSLFELFFIVTLTAVAVGVYIYISKLLVVIAGCSLVVITIIRKSGRQYAVSGGIVGFVTALGVAFLASAVMGLSTLATVGVMLAGATIAYPVGAIITELSNDAL